MSGKGSGKPFSVGQGFGFRAADSLADFAGQSGPSSKPGMRGYAGAAMDTGSERWPPSPCFSGFMHWLRAPVPAPTYRRLTFEAGTVYSARFAPDGDSILYSAAWNGKPVQLFPRSEILF